MAIQQLSEDVLLVELPSAGPKIDEQLNAVNEMVSTNSTYHVLIDFFRVELFNSWNISTLLALRSLLQDSGHQLVLYNVRVVTKCIFTVAGLRKAFIFAKNQEAALSVLEQSRSTTSVR